MKRLLMQKKGMTIVELVLSLAILAIVVVPFSGMFLSSARIQSASSDYLKATQLAQSVMEEYKNGGDRIEEAMVNAESTEHPMEYASSSRDGLTAVVYLFDFAGINHYNSKASGFPESFDITSYIKKEKDDIEEKDTITVSYFYYDNSTHSDMPLDSDDVFDLDDDTEDENIKALHLEKTSGGTVKITISRYNGEIAEIERAVNPEDEGEAIDFRIECLDTIGTGEVEYEVFNESGIPLNLYKTDHLKIDSDTGEVTAIYNNAGITPVKGEVSVKSGGPGQNFICGKYYIIRVKVLDRNGRELATLYGLRG